MAGNSPPPTHSEQVALERPLPSNVESEKILLGSVLIDNDKMVELDLKLRPDDFYSPMHRSVYSAMQTLYTRQSPIDPILIGEELKGDGTLERIGGTIAITQLSFGMPGAIDLESHIDLVLEKSYARGLIKTCAEITSEALQEEMDREMLMQFAEHKIHELADGEHQSDFVPIGEAMAESINASRQRAETGDIIIGLSTGLLDLDEKLKGMRDGASIVLAARPSVGKTTLGLNICQNTAFRDDKLVAVFSMEMSRDELTDKIVVSEAGIHGDRYALGHLSDDEWNDVEEVQALLADKKLVIDDTPYMSPQMIRSKLRRLEQKEGRSVDLVMIDYLQLMGDGDKQFRQNEVADISRNLKLIAREFSCPMLILSQLNRDSEKRASHRPTMADLRESGAIEQDADVVMFIFREDLYMPDPAYHTHEAEVIIAKNRKTGTGVAKLMFDGAKSTFRNLALGDQSQGDF